MENKKILSIKMDIEVYKKLKKEAIDNDMKFGKYIDHILQNHIKGN